MDGLLEAAPEQVFLVLALLIGAIVKLVADGGDASGPADNRGSYVTGRVAFLWICGGGTVGLGLRPKRCRAI
jgi:hypothetical protein